MSPANAGDQADPGDMRHRLGEDLAGPPSEVADDAALPISDLCEDRYILTHKSGLTDLRTLQSVRFTCKRRQTCVHEPV